MVAHFYEEYFDTIQVEKIENEIKVLTVTQMLNGRAINKKQYERKSRSLNCNSVGVTVFHYLNIVSNWSKLCLLSHLLFSPVINNKEKAEQNDVVVYAVNTPSVVQEPISSRR